MAVAGGVGFARAGIDFGEHPLPPRAMMDFSHPHFEAPRWLWLAVVAPLLLAWLQHRAAVKRRQQLAQIASPRFVERTDGVAQPGAARFQKCLVAARVRLRGHRAGAAAMGRVDNRADNFSARTWCLSWIVPTACCPRTSAPTGCNARSWRSLILSVLHGRGRVGLVAFAGSAFLQCPLTLDYDAFQNSLDALDEKTIPVPGTDIGRALRRRTARWKKTAGASWWCC